MTVLVDACLSWTLRQAGTWGTADVLTGLRDGSAPDGELGRPAELVDYSYGQSRRMPATRRLDRPPVAESVIDLAAAGILQWFGVAEPPHIASDGAVRSNEWGVPRQGRDIATWADLHGVGRGDWA